MRPTSEYPALLAELSSKLLPTDSEAIDDAIESPLSFGTENVLNTTMKTITCEYYPNDSLGGYRPDRNGFRLRFK